MSNNNNGGNAGQIVAGLFAVVLIVAIIALRTGVFYPKKTAYPPEFQQTQVPVEYNYAGSGPEFRGTGR